MPNLHELENAMPVAPLKIIALPSAEKMGRRINDYMVEFRKSIHNDKVKNDPAFHGYIESNYLVDVDVPRFGSGEAKAQISETIRGFREILDGKHDDIPESYFLNAGSIDDVLARVK